MGAVGGGIIISAIKKKKTLLVNPQHEHIKVTQNLIIIKQQMTDSVT